MIDPLSAGASIPRPCAAVKELLENSIDARSTSIDISVRQGGLKLIKVKDNGIAIYTADLPLLCTPHATSKLQAYHQLTSLQTLGFRGDALASLSQLAHVLVRTMKVNANVMVEATYEKGKLLPPLKFRAGDPGTTFIVEDLFYTIPTKKASFIPLEEYKAIVDLVAKYSLRYPHCAFSCRNLDSPGSSFPKADIRTHSSASVVDNISTIFGDTIANQLILLSLDLEKEAIQLTVWTTNPTSSLSKASFILFVNGRLVHCDSLEHVVISAYSTFLSPDRFPFTLIHLRIKPDEVDVNVHPAKDTVIFLHEKAIANAVFHNLVNALKQHHVSRPTRTLLINPDDSICTARAVSDMRPPSNDGSPFEMSTRTQATRDRIFPGTVAVDREELVDCKEGCQALAIPAPKEGNTSFGIACKSNDGTIQSKRDNSVLGCSHGCITESLLDSGSQRQDRLCHPKEVKGLSNSLINDSVFEGLDATTSIAEMLSNVVSDHDKDLANVLSNHEFIATHESHMFLWHKSKILAAEIRPVIMEILYQQALLQFGNFKTLELTKHQTLREHMQMFLESEMNIVCEAANIEVLKYSALFLREKKFLNELFGLSVCGSTPLNASLKTLPILCPGVLPNIEYLGCFLYRIATESDCLDGYSLLRIIPRALADWYGNHYLPILEHIENIRTRYQDFEAASSESALAPLRQGREGPMNWLHRIICISMQTGFYPPKNWKGTVIIEAGDTNELLKMFERC